MTGSVPEKGGLETDRDRHPVHAKVETWAYVGPTVPFGSGPLQMPLDVKGEGAVGARRTAGALMVGRALQGIHQAARPMRCHHPTGDRVSQKAPQVPAPKKARAVAHVAPDPVKTASSVLDPDGRPS